MSHTLARWMSVGLVCGLAFGQDPALEPRLPLDTGPVLVPPGTPPELGRRLTVKFADAVRARADAGGELVSEAGLDLSPVLALARAEGLRFERRIRTADARLVALEERAAARSGVAQPDLRGFHVVHVDGPSDDARLEQLGNALQALPQVEFAHVQLTDVPPPEDLDPPTPQYKGLQGYRGDDPGISVDFAWWWNARGNGIRLSDCEYAWNADHEDLNEIDLHLEPGQTIHEGAMQWMAHGTAVVGQTSAPDHGYGVAGMVPGAEIYTYPEKTVQEGDRRLTAVTNAIADSFYGDVVLLEMQTLGPGGGYAPAEIAPAIWAVTRAGTDAGVIVVAAAGNGNQDLDSAPYAPYMGWGDSGAILVGAGTPDTNHDKDGGSTYGSRVNLQGWGSAVFTLGKGTFAEHGGDPNQRYRDDFNGTSAASPFVASACVAINSHLLHYGHQLYDPAQMRALLIATGIPQGAGGHIGPLPDLRAAIEYLDVTPEECPPGWLSCEGQPNSTGDGAVLKTLGTTSVTANDLSFLVRDLPAGQPGYFLYGGSDAHVPLGDGVLCVGSGGIGLLRILPVDVAGANGVVLHPIDLTQAPFDAGPGEILPGSTWYFQFWYRDTPAFGGAGFNFSDSLGLGFCP